MWLMPKRRRYRTFLRKVADSVGPEIAAWSYETFLKPAEEICFTHEVEGWEIRFHVEVFDRDHSGALHVCVDFDTDQALFPLSSPCYVFSKSPGGTVSY